MNIAQNSTYRKAMGYQAAGTGDTLTGTAIDTQGYRRTKFMALFGAIAGGAVVTFKIQGDSASAFNVAATDITSATITVPDDDDNQVAVIEVVSPSETYRYLRAAVVRAGGQNCTVDAIICELSDGDQLPAPQSSTYVSTGTVVSVPCQ